MKTLCYVLFVILNVVANEDNFIDVDDTRKALEVGDAPYFVTILQNNAHVGNGVILSERFVLTAVDCILQDMHAHSVVYGTTQFGSDISSDNKKDILNVLGFREVDRNGGNNRLKKYIRRNKYTDRGHCPVYNHSNNENDNDHDYEYSDYEDSYDTVKRILSQIFAVEVEPFTFDNNVNKIHLPYPYEEIPSDKGTLVFRSADESLQSQQFPSESEALALNSIELYHGKVSRNEKHLLRGSPFVINNTLYGLLAVTEDGSGNEDDIDEDTSLLLNIPRVIDLIRDII